jgi:hypothetical protein
MTDSVPTPPASAYPITPELHVVRHHEGRVLAFQVTALNRATIERWSEFVVTTLRQWPEDRPYLALHDLSARKVALSYATIVKQNILKLGLTDAGQQQINQIIDARPTFVARVALVFNTEFSGHLGQFMIAQKAGGNPAVQYKTFFEVTDAMAWLEAGLQGMAAKPEATKPEATKSEATKPEVANSQS